MKNEEFLGGFYECELQKVKINGMYQISRAIMKERLRWLGHVLRIKDDRLPKVVLFYHPSEAKRKTGRPRLGWEDVINKE